jgi:acid phosphatase type 7
MNLTTDRSPNTNRNAMILNRTAPGSADRRRRNAVLPLLAVLGGLAGGCGPATATLATSDRPDARIAAPGEAVTLLLTWQRDPATTMVIDWHTTRAEADATLSYRAEGEQTWRRARAGSLPFPHAERWIHRVELTGLRSDATYEFRTGTEEPVYRFRTMPRTASRPVRFVAGGDVRHDAAWMEATARQATAYDPDFVLWGGDLAYADGRPDRVYRWFEFLDAMRNSMITPEGRVIPVLAAIGNHEIAGSYHHWIDGYSQDDDTRARIAPFFFALYASPGQPGYGAIDFGDYMSVLLLDTDHANPIEGDQTAWLEETLRERRNVPHLFPLYHVPAYPSVRSFDGETSARVREHWVPLFERYGVRVAFENHDHAYKRTVALRGGEPHPDGIVFLGDGAWGVGVREIGRDWPEGERPPYLARGESVRHFILGEIEGTARRFVMVDEEGVVFDEYPDGARAVIGEPRWDAELLAERAGAERIAR